MTRRAPAGRWKVLVGLCGLMLVIAGIGLTTVGVFLQPIRNSFGLSTTRMFLLPAIVISGRYVIGPLIGWLIEKISARLVIGVGAAAAAVGYTVGATQQSFEGFALLFALAALGVGSSTLIPCMTVARRWFQDDFGSAMGWLTASLLVGAAVMPPLLADLIGRYGWRTTMQGCGVVMLATAVVMLLFLIRDRPPGAAMETPRAPPEAVGAPPSVKTFVVITAAVGLASLGLTGVYFAIIPFALELDYSLKQAGALVGMMNAVSAGGCIVAGGLADRIGVRRVLLVSLAANAICILQPLWIVGQTHEAGALLALVVVFGLFQSVPAQLGPALLASVFGEEVFARLSGTMMLLVGVIGGISPVLVGGVYDLTGSYLPGLALCAACLMLSMLLTFLSHGASVSLTWPAGRRDGRRRPRA